MENNKLIAEFMGNETIFNTIHDATLYNIKEQGAVVYELSELKYHISWDWLMPVVEKILDISFQDEGDAEDFYSIRDCIPDRNHTHKALIEFIKGYNNLNK